MASHDLAHVLAELAAIQRDVKALVDLGSMLRGSATEICSRIGMLMASITAPPPAVAPVDNGMLAPIRARLDELERKVESLTKSAEGYEWAVGMGHHIKALVGRHIFIDGGDPGDEQEAS